MAFVMGLQRQRLQMLELFLCYTLVTAWQSAHIDFLIGVFIFSFNFSAGFQFFQCFRYFIFLRGFNFMTWARGAEKHNHLPFFLTLRNGMHNLIQVGCLGLISIIFFIISLFIFFSYKKSIVFIAIIKIAFIALVQILIIACIQGAKQFHHQPELLNISGINALHLECKGISTWDCLLLSRSKIVGPGGFLKVNWKALGGKLEFGHVFFFCNLQTRCRLPFASRSCLAVGQGLDFVEPFARDFLIVAVGSYFFQDVTLTLWQPFWHQEGISFYASSKNKKMNVINNEGPQKSKQTRETLGCLKCPIQSFGKINKAPRNSRKPLLGAKIRQTISNKDLQISQPGPHLADTTQESQASQRNGLGKNLSFPRSTFQFHLLSTSKKLSSLHFIYLSESPLNHLSTKEYPYDFIVEVLDSPEKRDRWSVYLNFPSWCWEDCPPGPGSWIYILTRVKLNFCSVYMVTCNQHATCFKPKILRIYVMALDSEVLTIFP
ncbi:putative signal peptide protein [Puccinia sorghi]|uniref:Putative signal peptide protein n=1 Tax=Puccinia sorghi TaxID=27349 RepID=A0A0L6VAV7_9BASI|nr:putative signal peptide protein [Puccinia sorghi]